MSKKNPLNLSIGDRVRVSHISIVTYVDDKKVVEKIANDKVLTITGSKVKCTGTYEDGQQHQTMDGEFDYEPPRLKVDKRIRFYLCKERFDSQEVMVHPDDIYVIPKLNALISFRESPLAIITINGDKTTNEILNDFSERGKWNIGDLKITYLQNLTQDNLNERS